MVYHLNESKELHTFKAKHGDEAITCSRLYRNVMSIFWVFQKELMPDEEAEYILKSRLQDSLK